MSTRSIRFFCDLNNRRATNFNHMVSCLDSNIWLIGSNDKKYNAKSLLDVLKARIFKNEKVEFITDSKEPTKVFDYIEKIVKCI